MYLYKKQKELNIEYLGQVYNTYDINNIIGDKVYYTDIDHGINLCNIQHIYQEIFDITKEKKYTIVKIYLLSPTHIQIDNILFKIDIVIDNDDYFYIINYFCIYKIDGYDRLLNIIEHIYASNK